jgi:Protein of unknown function (DUF2958)
MTLITKQQTEQLLANGIAALEAGRAGLHFDPKPVVKLFTPHSYGRWLLTEIDPVHTDRAYGLCDSGHGLPELGFVSLRDLENIHGPQRTTLVGVRNRGVHQINVGEHDFGKIGIGEFRLTQVHILKSTIHQFGICKMSARNIGIVDMQYFADIVSHCVALDSFRDSSLPDLRLPSYFGNDEFPRGFPGTRHRITTQTP